VSDSSLERFLAALYTDPELQAKFLADPAGSARDAGLAPRDCAAVLRIDPTELRLAARSYARKRHQRVAAVVPSPTFVQRCLRAFRKLART
jgi:hypothetical protein